MVFRKVTRQVVESEAKAKRHPIDRPTILGEESHLRRHDVATVEVRRRPLEDLRWNTLVELVSQAHVVVVRIQSRVRPGVAVTGLERMRASDVGHRSEPGTQVLLDARNRCRLRTDGISETPRVGSVEEAGRLLVYGYHRSTRRRVEVRLTFDQQPRL